MQYYSTESRVVYATIEDLNARLVGSRPRIVFGEGVKKIFTAVKKIRADCCMTDESFVLQIRTCAVYLFPEGVTRFLKCPAFPASFFSVLEIC